MSTYVVRYGLAASAKCCMWSFFIFCFCVWISAVSYREGTRRSRTETDEGKSSVAKRSIWGNIRIEGCDRWLYEYEINTRTYISDGMYIKRKFLATGAGLSTFKASAESQNYMFADTVR